MLPYDVVGGNFVVLPPSGFLVPQAEGPGSPGQNSKKKGLEGEAKVLGVSPAARGAEGGGGLSAGDVPTASTVPGCRSQDPGPPRAWRRGSGHPGLFPPRARGRRLSCSWGMFS